MAATDAARYLYGERKSYCEAAPAVLFERNTPIDVLPAEQLPAIDRTVPP